MSPSTNLPSDTLLRHIKDQHSVNGTSSEDGRQSDRSTRLPGVEYDADPYNIAHEGVTGTDLSQHVETEHQMLHQIRLSDGMAPDDERPHEINHISPPYGAPGATPGWSQILHPASIAGINMSPMGSDFDVMYPNFLAYGNLDGFVQEWPFVVDNGDMNVLAQNQPQVDLSLLEDPNPTLQQIWFTNFDHSAEDQAVSGYATPVPPHGQNDVDDDYRQSLHRRLHVRPFDQNLPSASYLNSCVKFYFMRFNPVFPVIHASTFRPSKTNAVLLLSICSLGSLFTGHPDAYQRGVQLFERLHKAILNHWERFMRRGAEERFCMIQAALLGQTFGLLSGKSEHLALVDAFHGTIMSWARRLKIFEARHGVPKLGAPPAIPNKEDIWDEWIRTEEKIRAASIIRIHDAEVAYIVQHPPLLSRAAKACPVAASDTLFFASSYTDWCSEYANTHDRNLATSLDSPASERSSNADMFPEILQQRLSTYQGKCYFSVNVALEDLSSAVLEARNNDCLSNNFIQQTQQTLKFIYKQFLSKSTNKHLSMLQSSVKLLWHFVHIALYADLDLLEKAIGRDGSTLNSTDLATVQNWARSRSAIYCIAHAVLIKRSFETFSLQSEPGIHVPRIIFACVLCLFCYSKHGNGVSTETDYRSNPHAPDVHAPEFPLLEVDISALLREATGYQSSSASSPYDTTSAIYGLCDLLRRVGHWEISRKFASIVTVLMQNESRGGEAENPG